MRIQSHRSARHQVRRVQIDIAYLNHARSSAGRVCGDACSFRCPECGSTSCQCRCSPACPEAGRALSSDPERYPIEPRILPLVFAMKRVRIFDPCWSCEGHLASDGSLWKMPMVWFYCRSMVYLRLLKDGLDRLRLAGMVRAPWDVAVTYSDPGNPDTTFSVQPSAVEGQLVSLSGLQADVSEIATTLDQLMEQGVHSLRSAG